MVTISETIIANLHQESQELVEAEELVFDMKWKFLESSCGELIIDTGSEVTSTSGFSSESLSRSTPWTVETPLKATQWKAGATLRQVKG